MKRIARTARLLGAAICLAPLGCAVRWDLDYNYARGVAEQQKRPMVLYFKDWSSPDHRNFVSQVLQSPIVARELKDTVNVELLHNWGPAAQLYKVENKPQVCIVCAPNGREIDRLVVNNPIPSADKFAEWLRRAKAAARPASQPSGAKVGAAPASPMPAPPRSAPPPVAPKPLASEGEITAVEPAP